MPGEQKIYLTLEADRAITPFIQRHQGPTKLHDSTLDLGVGGFYCDNHLLDLEIHRTTNGRGDDHQTTD